MEKLTWSLGTVIGILFSIGNFIYAQENESRAVISVDTTQYCKTVQYVTTFSSTTATKAHGSISALDFSLDGKKLYSIIGLRPFSWDIPDGKEVEIHLTPHALDEMSEGISDFILYGTPRCMRYIPETQSFAVAFGPNNLLGPYISPALSVALFCISTGKIEAIQQCPVRDHSNNISCVEISKDGKWIVYGDYSYTSSCVTGFDISAGKTIFQANATGEFDRSNVPAAALSNPGDLAATGENDGSIRLFNLRDKGNFLREFRGHQGDVCCLSFSEDGKRLVSGAFDKTIQVWDVTKDNEKPIAHLGPLQSRPNFLAFRNENEIVCVGDGGFGCQEVLVWRYKEPVVLSTNPLIQLLNMDYSFEVSISQDGRYLAISEGDEKIDLYEFMTHTIGQYSSSETDVKEFLKAVAEGNLEVAERYLKTDPRLADEQDSLTALTHAVYSGEAMVDLLLKNGADPNKVSANSWPPLMTALFDGNIEVVEMLVSKGADVNFIDGYSNPLFHVLWKRDYDDATKKIIAEILLRSGADVNGKNKFGWTVLYDFIVMKQYQDKKDIIAWLIDKGADVNTQDNKGETLLNAAIKEGIYDIVQLLISKGARLDVMDSEMETPLHVAVDFNHGSLKMVEMLIENGADVNIAGKYGIRPLHLAPTKQMAKLLLAKGAPIDAKDNYGCTPLHGSARCSEMEMVQFFLAAGSKVDTLDGFEKTPLHYAAGSWNKEHQTETVAFLLAEGAKLNPVDHIGKTPLHEAAAGGTKETVELLIAKGAEIQVKDFGGKIPLHHAAYEGGQERVIEVLLAKGAKVDAKDNSGDTPLHLAAERGYIETVKVLIEHGSDVNARNKEGLTPLAKTKKRWLSEEVDEFLRSRGGTE